MEESKAKQIYQYTASRIAGILNMADDSAQRATLATLRRGIGHTPGEQPELWGFFLKGLPKVLYGEGPYISAAESAIFNALTLFALHQQGNDKPMHCKNIGLGTAMAQLVHDADDEKRIRSKFNIAATSGDIQELVWHIKSAIHLLSGEKIQLDYARLAVDFFRFQNTDGKDTVQLLWGRDFYQQLYFQSNHNSKEILTNEATE